MAACQNGAKMDGKSSLSDPSLLNHKDDCDLENTAKIEFLRWIKLRAAGMSGSEMLALQADGQLRAESAQQAVAFARGSEPPLISPRFTRISMLKPSVAIAPCTSVARNRPSHPPVSLTLSESLCLERDQPA